MKLGANERKTVALHALAGTKSVADLAAQHGVSRPLIYRQRDQAQATLDALFSTDPATSDEVVLFHLPVTRQWIQRTAVGLSLIGHASQRGIVEFLRDIVGVSVSVGNVQALLQRIAQQAITINDNIDLSGIRVGLHDEIFLGSRPVLAGVDARSTFCYLLRDEAQRDGDTWAIHLLDLCARGRPITPSPTRAQACGRGS